jgi:Trk K+ transport system NAD-binding subunit
MAEVYADWHGHVIVCGLRGVGLRIVEQLNLAGVPAVVLEDDRDASLSRILLSWGVPRVAGSSRAADSLLGAGLEGAAAVICVQNDDLYTLETALLIRQLRPDVRVVVQFGNPAVGRALAQAGVIVLDVAALSAPSMVEASLRSDRQEFTLSGEEFAAVRTPAPRAASLRELYGALAPVAVVPADGAEVAVCPGRDLAVEAGDDVTLFGTPAELRAAEVGGSGVGAARTNPTVAARMVRRVERVVLSVLHAGDRRLGLAVAVLLGMLAASTSWLRLTYHPAGASHLSLLDAAYFTVETITTVGYGDFYFRGQNWWVEAGGIGLMLAGAAFVAVFFALLTNIVVDRRIAESLGQQRVTELTGHVLVIGLGAVGMQAVRQLVAAGRDIVVIEKDEHNRHLGQARALGVPVVVADATQPETLESVRLSRASAVAVLTSDDLANVETGLAVRDQLGPDRASTPVVLRIFDSQLARSIRRGFGFTSVRSTEALAAPWFVGAALGLDVLSTFYVGDEPLLLARLIVSPGGGLDGVAMLDLGTRTRVLALRRAADRAILEHPPRRNTRFRPDDEAYLIGPYEELLTVLRRDRPSPGDPDSAAPVRSLARDGEHG